MDYQELLIGIKHRIRQGQTKAALKVNAEMLLLYHDIGRMIDERQHAEGWGAGVVPRLARDIKNELAGIKGFSERNLNRMLSFYREYKDLLILPPAVAKLIAPSTPLPITTMDTRHFIPSPLNEEAMDRDTVLKLPWASHIILMEKVKDLPTRLWYMKQTILNGWTRDQLSWMIKTAAHERQGKSTTNFDLRLPVEHSDAATEMLKDPYIFDFLTLDEPFRERELESNLILHLEKFLLEMGTGFAFIGRQYRLDIGGQEFYIDLLFYHMHLRCYVVVDLKTGPFRPTYAGQLNFYCSAVDDTLRREQDGPTIGLILCQEKNKVVAEYALRGMQQPIGVSEYDLTRALPEDLKSSLPEISDIEEAFGDEEV